MFTDLNAAPSIFFIFRNLYLYIAIPFTIYNNASP